MTHEAPTRINAARPKILFLHLSSPAQFEFLGKWLARQGWDVTFAHGGDGVDTEEDGVRTRWFRLRETVIKNRNDVRHILDYAATNCISASDLLYRMHYAEGYVPDLVMAHVGWGVGLCVKDVWPECKYIAYHEWYYTKRNWATGKDEAPRPGLAMVSDRMRNLPIAGEFDLADANWCPTEFQASRFPPVLRRQMTVISDGVDCALHAPDPDARIDLDWVRLPKDRHIVTYATRGMEPLRGFPQFLRGLELLQQQRDDFDAVIIANNSVAYGDSLPEGDSWWLRMVDDLDLDHRRIHMNAMLPREEYARILQASSAHVYFTEPFVTSWSLSESMALGCLIIASNTAPVTELIEDMENGVIVDMDDPEEIAEMVSWAFDHPQEAAQLRNRARQFILDHHNAEHVFPAKEAILRQLIGETAR